MTQQGGQLQPAPAERQGWSVLSQSETTGADETGNYVRGMTVSFRTASGLQGSVFVPLTRFSADTVRQAISERVQLMTGVQQLQG